MERILRFNIVLLMLLSMLSISSSAFADYDDDRNNERSEVFKALGLLDGVILNLRKPTTDQVRVGVISEVATINGQLFILDLHPHSLRSRNFTTRVQLSDGSYRQMEAGVSRAVKGSVRGIDGSRIVGSVLENGLAAKIIMPNGVEFFIEPIPQLMRGENTRAHVVYRSTDVAPHDTRCGIVDPVTTRRDTVAHVIGRSGSRPLASSNQNPQPRAGSAIQIAELAIDADFEFFQLNGTVENTIDRIELVVGITNDQYETQTGITHAISTIIIRAAEPDPYDSLNAFTLLDQFVAHWLNEQQDVVRDAAHLFTGKNLGGIGGVAFLGGMCDPAIGFGLSRIDFNGSLVCSTDLLAHELGHNWSANHCNCQNNTMNGGFTCTNVFTPAAANTIMQFASSLDCLDVQSDVLMGDVNLDEEVNLLDVGPFVDLLTSGEFQLEADINQDGSVDLLDIGLFVALLTGS